MSLPSPQPGATVVVTGASSGIGAELARGLAALGHGLTVVARRRDRLDALAGELRAAHGVHVDVHAADLADDAERKAFIAAVAGGGRHVAAVCNNAAFGTVRRFADTELEREQRQVHLNVVALHELTGAFLHGMLDQGEGAILNVGSTAAFQPLPGFATYAATKAFVVSFSEALHAELAGTGVSCTHLSPGPVSTEFGEKAKAGDLERRLPGFVPMQPAEVAGAAIEAMRKGHRSVIPGLGPRLGALGGRYVPRGLFLPVAKAVADRVR